MKEVFFGVGVFRNGKWAKGGNTNKKQPCGLPAFSPGQALGREHGTSGGGLMVLRGRSLCLFSSIIFGSSHSPPVIKLVVDAALPHVSS